MRNKKAFTLIEVMVVMAIIAVLAILIIGAIQLARRTSTETTHRSNAKGVQTALERVYATNKVYCGTGTAPTCTDTDGDSTSKTAISVVTNMDAFMDAIEDPADSDTSCNGQKTIDGVTYALENGVGIANLGSQYYSIIAVSYNCTAIVDSYNLN